MSSIFRFLSKNIPWVIEALLPSLVILFAYLIGTFFEFTGLIPSVIFIACFLFLLLRDRRVWLRKGFIATVAIVMLDPGIAEALKNITGSDHLNIILSVVVAIVDTINRQSELMQFGLVVVSGTLAALELFAVDWAYSDKNSLINRKALKITSKDTNNEGIWWFKFGSLMFENELIDVISFKCKLNVSNQHSDTTYYLQDVLKNVRLGSQFWGSMKVLQSNVVINNDQFNQDPYSSFAFRPDEEAIDVEITWDVRTENLPWYVNRFKPDSLDLSFEIKDDSASNHFISEKYTKL